MTDFLRRLRFRHLLWVTAPLLLVWALRRVSLAAVWTTLSRLSVPQLLILTVVNVGVVVALSGRWWTVLRSLGHRLPYLRVCAYRLAAFAVSYFTPGQHFGGEPLQAYLVQLRHGVRGSTAAASVVLDKALELLANFTFLMIGVLALSELRIVPHLPAAWLVGLAAALLALPVAYLLAARRGARPLTALLARLSVRAGEESWLARIRPEVAESEALVAALCRSSPWALIAATGLSALSWLMLVGEYALMLRYLGIRLPLLGVVGVLAAARLSLLLPLPGGLGALEASQVLALSALGYAPAEGAGLALLIRARDVLFGAVGLALGSALAGAPRRGLTTPDDLVT